jgi:hypothetical protein
MMVVVVGANCYYFVAVGNAIIVAAISLVAMDDNDNNDGDYCWRAAIIIVVLSMCYNGHEGLLPRWRRYWGWTANLSRPWALLSLWPRS